MVVALATPLRTGRAPMLHASYYTQGRRGLVHVSRPLHAPQVEQVLQTPPTSPSPPPPMSGLASLHATTTNSNANIQHSLTSTRKTGVTRTQPRSQRAILTLTPRAVARLRELRDAGDGAAQGPRLLKIGTQQKGCSGNSYKLEYVSGPSSRFDEVVSQDGVDVIVDSKALLTIIGSEMDYIEDDLRQEFVFNNPNVKETCGCGQSFLV